MGNSYSNFGVPASIKNLLIDDNLNMGSFDITTPNLNGNVTGNVTGNLNGTTIRDRCIWSTTNGDNFTTIVPAFSLSVEDSNSASQTVYVNYPGTGCVTFQPEINVPVTYTGTIGLTGGSITLTTYDYDNNVLHTYTGTGIKNIDLENVYKIYGHVQADAGHYYTTLSFSGLYLKYPSF